MSFFKCAVIVLGAGVMVALVGCVSPPQTRALLNAPPDIPAAHVIEGVPFFAQDEYFCGPTTLAEVFNFYGANSTPSKVAPDVFVPELKGSLQIEMHSAVRKNGLLPYSDKGNLSQLLGLVSDGIPVIILQNLSVNWLPAWHYAVVVGYDLNRKELVLHSGQTAHYRLRLSVFERTWARAEYWFLVAVPPDLTSAHFHPYKFTQAAQDLVAVGRIDAGVSALTAATERWQESWLAYFLLANTYIQEQPRQSVEWFKKGFAYGKNQATYLNNYAHALNALACPREALSLSQRALALAPADPIVQNTHEIAQALVASCPDYNEACAAFMPNAIAPQKSDRLCRQ